MSGPPEPAAADEPRVRVVGHRYAHHAGRSGYDRIAEHLGGRLACEGGWDLAARSVLRLPGKLLGWYGGMYPYSRRSFADEVRAAAHSLRRPQDPVFFLYAETHFLMSGRLPRAVRRSRLGAAFHYPRETFTEQITATRQFRRLDFAVCMSRCQVPWVRELAPGAEVRFVPHGVDCDYWRPAEKSAARPPGRPLRCLYAGSHLRDSETFAEFARRAGEAGDAVFEVVGGPPGPLPGEGRTLRRHRNLSDEAYRRLIQECDLLTLPLLRSTAVNVVLEALACGVPAVITEGGAADYLNAACGRVVPAGDAAALAAAVAGLRRDEPLRLRMAAAARRRAEELDWPAVAGEVRELALGGGAG